MNTLLTLSQTPHPACKPTHSHKADVWAFGVLLWEIGTLARTPWGAFGVKEMADSIRSGDRLLAGPDTPAALYSIMLRCWNIIPVGLVIFFFNWSSP